MTENSVIIWTNETRKLSDLIPWEHNPRQIGRTEAERLVASKKKFDQPWPLVIRPGNELYDGHQRLNVWGKEYGDIEVAVRVASRPLTELERQELTVVGHKGAAGEFDFDMLANWGLEAELLEWGFSEEELVGIWPEDDPPADPGPQLDRAAELQGKWQVERGQVWQIGAHRLMCGDSTSAEDVNALGQLPENLIYDPPWNAELNKDNFVVDWKGVIGFCDGYRARDIMGLFGTPTWIFT